MKTLSAILLGKLISHLTRSLNLGGGSAAPGLFALRIDPELVVGLSSKISKNIVITGTNGKTTTARMVAHFAKASGLKVIRNHTGSNLERGIASTLISHYTPYPIPHTLGIWELDEAAFNTVAPKLNPDIIVFLNVFRDQLDRYGEVDTIIKGWVETLKKLDKGTIVLVNGDDANTARLKSSFKGKVYQFGVRDYKIAGEGIQKRIDKENLDFEAKNVKLNGLSGSKFQLTITRPSFGGNNEPLTINLPLPGIYHIYDFIASFALGHELGLSTQSMISSLKSFQPAFGRVEKLDFGYIFLIKNPVGATQVFQTIAPQFKKQDRLLLALNDNLADGTDISWIWDADFELLLSPSLRAQRGNLKSISLQAPLIKRLPRHSVPRNDVVVSGTRAYDLAVRLKYAGFDPKNITIEPELQNALKQARIGSHTGLTGQKGRLFILPTYTAMLELQGILTKMGIKKNYWEES